MTGSSVKKSSASEALLIPGAGELHLWLCPRQAAIDTDDFLRGVLSRYTAVPPQDLRITRGPNGKPGLAAPTPPLAFNLSDSADWMALVVSGGAAVGIDLEYCDPNRDVVRLARRCFSAAERADLESLPALQQITRFYDYWTLKEARIKALGGSLGRELESAVFGLHFPSDSPLCGRPGRVVALPPAGALDAWYGLLQPLDQYRLALCCDAPDDFSGGLRFLQWPLAQAVTRPVPLLAVSAHAHPAVEAVCP